MNRGRNSSGGVSGTGADREDSKTLAREIRSGGLRRGHTKRSTRALPHAFESLLTALLLVALGMEAIQISTEPTR